MNTKKKYHDQCREISMIRMLICDANHVLDRSQGKGDNPYHGEYILLKHEHSVDRRELREFMEELRGQ